MLPKVQKIKHKWCNCSIWMVGTNIKSHLALLKCWPRLRIRYSAVDMQWLSLYFISILYNSIFFVFQPQSIVFASAGLCDWCRLITVKESRAVFVCLHLLAKCAHLAECFNGMCFSLFTEEQSGDNNFILPKMVWKLDSRSLAGLSFVVWVVGEENARCGNNPNCYGKLKCLRCSDWFT